jgi:hypothetical protein
MTTPDQEWEVSRAARADGTIQSSLADTGVLAGPPYSSRRPRSTTADARSTELMIFKA